MDAQITFRSEQRLTQEEFWEWLLELPTDDIHHYELIHGRIVMSPPASFGHGRAGAVLVRHLDVHVAKHDLGVVLSACAGYDLPSGDTLQPDVSFISRERLAAAPTPDPKRFTRIVPDLVVEILSPSTARRDRTEKKEIYAANGVREYWLVDPDKQAATVFHRRGTTYGAGTAVSSGLVPSEVLPELSLTVADIFRA